MSKRSNLQHIVTSLLISSVLTWIKRSMLAAALYRKKLKQVHRKTNPEKLEGQLANQMITLACCRV